MKTFYHSLLLTLGALALASTAYAQVPSSNDTSTSDGNQNTGMGTGALGGPTAVNLTGASNTAAGFNALGQNTSGGLNTAIGTGALNDNTEGSGNTASGVGALYRNTTGSQNTASGWNALGDNVGGGKNTAFGAGTLQTNTAGNLNAAYGTGALATNETGSNNSAVGAATLYSSTTGSNNIGLGYEAGYNVTTGSDNIEIGNEGAAGDNKVIKIGTEGTQKKTIIAGIYSNTAVSGLSVVIGSNGELGAVSSSERFKTAIAPIGSNTEKLQQLRPVTFRYKADAQGTLRYGLIAEQVAKVYPELVVRDETGRIDGVRYDELAPILLNEVQQQQQEIATQAGQLRDVLQQLAVLKEVSQATEVALRQLQAKDEIVAQR